MSSLVAQQYPPAMQEPQETSVWSLGREDPLEEETATHSSILAWEIPWTEEPGGLQSLGLQRLDMPEHAHISSTSSVSKASVCSVTHSSLTPCDPMDCNLPGSSVDGIFLRELCHYRCERIPNKWVNSLFICSSISLGQCGIGGKWKVKVKLLSHVRFFVTQWTVAYEFPPSMGFSQQEYWSGLPFPTPDDLPDPGIKPGSPALQAGAFTVWATWEAGIGGKEEQTQKQTYTKGQTELHKRAEMTQRKTNDIFNKWCWKLDIHRQKKKKPQTKNRTLASTSHTLFKKKKKFK